ncbi:MAG: Asp-tRNA(Asn)/Glu-tRNA(Gln) amidotransferase subunit GatB [Patescibacteria group bacterium]|jgi:aspartyl-tRNA(Asn)/glutamyl-tRNA(Gln) amidotransferase subunit B
MNYKTVVGLETHVELKTKQKMFCGCDANHFSILPNTHVCPVCLALPGALPVPNYEAIRLTILIGIALHCKINLHTYFERKHYFYPDLPKGYQISQYLKPLCYDGYLDIGTKKIRINRIHIEEDTGKLLHGQQMNEGNDVSYVDFNRSGVPLMEIVTEPDIENGDEAMAYLKKLQLTIQYLGASDCDMEKGSMRCEPNISVAKVESLKSKVESLPPYKVEVKNINSFNFVKKSIQYETDRHIILLERGETPKQETRRYVESKGSTESMRSKEDSRDYRYFPEPDIPPMTFDDQFITGIKADLAKTETPEKREKHLVETLKLREDLARELVEDKALGDLFNSLFQNVTDVQKLASFIINQKKNIDMTTPSKVLEQFKVTTEKQTADPAQVTKVVQDVITQNPKAVTDYKAGKQNSFQFLLGQCMRVLGRSVDTSTIIEELKKATSAI